MAKEDINHTLGYRFRKAVRYVRMYGPRRTVEKIRSHYHMKIQGDGLSSDWKNLTPDKKGVHDVAIIGCGNFSYSNIAYYCNLIQPGCIRCAYDPVGDRAISLIRRYGGVYASADPIQMLGDPFVRTVFVASNHSTHAEYAIEAIKRGKIVHIEKPHVVNAQQLERLKQVLNEYPQAKIFLGFNRPRSQHFKRVQNVLNSESGPLMINWFVAGHELDPKHWYFSSKEGGRILGNLCHWTDMTLRLVGLERAFPIKIHVEKNGNLESNLAVTLNFGDGTIGVISFSAKGRTFDGVRECLNVHKGDTIISLQDFHATTFYTEHKKIKYSPFFRDHGHGAAIAATLDGTSPESEQYIIESARLFLAIKDAVDGGGQALLQPQKSPEKVLANDYSDFGNYKN